MSTIVLSLLFAISVSRNLVPIIRAGRFASLLQRSRANQNKSLVEPGRFRVIEGDYDTYQHFVEVGMAKKAASRSPSEDNSKTTTSKKVKRTRPARPTRRRKFPYRKTSDIEAEILERETQVEQLHTALSSPEFVRDGQRTKAVKAEIEEHQAALSSLYDHWEEAVELD